MYVRTYVRKEQSGFSTLDCEQVSIYKWIELFGAFIRISVVLVDDKEDEK